MIKKKTRNTQDIVLLVIVGMLLIASSVQGYQLNELRQEGVQTRTTTSQAPQTSGVKEETTIPQNLRDLPQMVGGC